MEHSLDVKTHSPTPDLVDQLINALAGQSADYVIAYMRAYDSGGTKLAEASISPTDWSNHQVQKSLTVTTAGELAYLTLETANGLALYRYDLASPITVNVNDVINVTWTIGVTLGTNMVSVDYILEAIEGSFTDPIEIAQATFFEAGSAVFTATSSNATITKTPDTANDKITVQITFTPSSAFGYDQITLGNSLGIGLLTISATGSVEVGVEVTVTIEISIHI